MSPKQDAKAGRNARGGAAKARPSPLDALADAVESGAGLPAVARAAADALDASVALIDRSSAVLAVPAGEQTLLAGAGGGPPVGRRGADGGVGAPPCGTRREAAPDPVAARMVST